MYSRIISYLDVNKILVDNLCNASNILEFILFADDTNIFYSHQNLNILMSTVNTEIEKLFTWLQSNRLSINLKKTNFILFKPRERKLTCDAVLEINKSPIDRVNEVVLLGVVLDESLSWKPHILLISNKIF